MQFRLQFKVQNGTAVMNDLGHEVGFVVGCEQVPGSEGHQRIGGASGRLVEGPLWEVTADIAAEAVNSKLQCLEPTFPVA
jgi:hypothetical protein